MERAVQGFLESLDAASYFTCRKCDMSHNMCYVIHPDVHLLMSTFVSSTATVLRQGRITCNCAYTVEKSQSTSGVALYPLIWVA